MVGQPPASLPAPHPIQRALQQKLLYKGSTSVTVCPAPTAELYSYTALYSALQLYSSTALYTLQRSTPSLWVVFNEETHGNLSFGSFGRRYAVKAKSPSHMARPFNMAFMRDHHCAPPWP